MFPSCENEEIAQADKLKSDDFMMTDDFLINIGDNARPRAFLIYKQRGMITYIQ